MIGINIYIYRKLNCHARIRFMSSERKTLKVFLCPAYAHAPPYFCHHIRNQLDREMAGRWIGRGGSIAWPPRSLDLTPLDFFLWSYMKNIDHQVNINDLQRLKARIRDAMAMVTPNIGFPPLQSGVRNRTWSCGICG
jgi:hypothetical protein